MKRNRLRIMVFLFITVFIVGCIQEKAREKNIEKNTYSEQKENNIDFETNISEETTSKLCQVASYLKNQNFTGDFYLYNRKVKWCMGVDSIRIPIEIIELMFEEDIEYVAHAKGIFEFSFNPTENTKEIGEISLLLNNEPNNPLINSGNVRVEYIKLSNTNCLNLNWYLEIIK